ncbi:hypothetical protein [Conexibacter arvalis]|uniref:Uncharacterized protein n=1 Tax=Conexibacter arvalis TaxID=912552 RepID=A0A840IED2_9ACTN|nr:hypothetical protein [Conexibacter arvalis]MBB4663166.1 hypothetical protein [Conexibacter arvalis]
MRAVNKRGAIIRADVAVVERLVERGMKSPNSEAFVHDGLLMCADLAEAVHAGVNPGPVLQEQTAGFMAFARQNFSEPVLGRNLREAGLSVDQAVAEIGAGTLDPFENVDYPFKEAPYDDADAEKLATTSPDLGEDFVVIPHDEAQRIAHEIADKAAAMFEELAPPPDEVLSILQIGLLGVLNVQGRDPDDVQPDALLVGQTIARMGFNVRMLEFEGYNSAREADLDFLHVFQEWAEDPEFGGPGMDLTITEAAAQIASAETLDADPDDSAAFLWRVPGLGGAIRTLAAQRCVLAATIIDESGDRRSWEHVNSEDLLRTWIFGFAVRYMVELLNDGERMH